MSSLSTPDGSSLSLSQALTSSRFASPSGDSNLKLSCHSCHLRAQHPTLCHPLDPLPDPSHNLPPSCISPASCFPYLVFLCFVFSFPFLHFHFLFFSHFWFWSLLGLHFHIFFFFFFSSSAFSMFYFFFLFCPNHLTELYVVIYSVTFFPSFSFLHLPFPSFFFFAPII